MPSNEQRRAAAKRKLERQLARQVERAKRRRLITLGSVVVAILVVIGGVFYFTHDSAQAPAAQASNQPKPVTTGGPCGYVKSPEPASKPVGLPPDPNPTPTAGTVGVSLATSQGAVGLSLDRTAAPCTVQSFAHLVTSHYYDGTPCHRLTTGDGLKVLQCGDPTGQGSGGPGYTIKDEPPKDLRPAPAPYDQGGARVYPRGTLAMAKTQQPNSGGSQFFMVYQDSYLPPQYTAFGRIDDAGLSVLDKVAAAGAQPTMGEGDGSPNLPMRIDQATIQS